MRTLLHQRMSHILIVEDDPTIQQRLMTILEHEGIASTVVSEAHEAIHQLRRGASYNMVFMDFDLPYTDGLTLTRYIRTLSESLGAIPILGMAANGDPLRNHEGHAAGTRQTIHYPAITWRDRRLHSAH